MLPWKNVHAVSTAMTIAVRPHASSSRRTNASVKRRCGGASSDGVRGNTSSEVIDGDGAATGSLALVAVRLGGLGRAGLRVRGVLVGDRLRGEPGKRTAERTAGDL